MPLTENETEQRGAAGRHRKNPRDPKVSDETPFGLGGLVEVICPRTCSQGMHTSSDPRHAAACGMRAQSIYTGHFLEPVRGRLSELWSPSF